MDKNQQDAIAATQALRAALTAAFLERKAEATCLMVALLAREHVLLLGPPGTGKSAITLAMSKALKGAYFERLLTAFTTPEELFGPYSLQGLQEDRYERQTTGYLPGAAVAFLDEIFKAGSPILNALLTILNERAFDNGIHRMACPLQMCIGASNELPADASLDALYDRFVLRRWVSPIKDRDARRTLLGSQGEPMAGVTLTMEQIELARAAADAVVVPEKVVEAILDLHDCISKDVGIYVSDRRLRKMLKLVKAHAALNGRDVAVLQDLLILTDAIWQKPEDRPAINAVVCKIAAPEAAEALRYLDAANEQVAKLPPASLENIQARAKTNQELGKIIASLKLLGDSPSVVEVREKVEKIHADLVRDNMRLMAGK